MKKKSQKNQKVNEEEYTNVMIKECESKRTSCRKNIKGVFPTNGRIHKKGYYQPK
jgi:hypothetical protein